MNRNDSHYFSVLECVSVSLFTRPYREHHVQRQWELSIIRTKRALKDLVLSPTGATSPITFSISWNWLPIGNTGILSGPYPTIELLALSRLPPDNTPG